MGILDKLFNRKSSSTAASDAPAPECLHVALMGRWDSVADMGKEDKITVFVCDACHQTFTPEEGRRLRVTTAERLNVEDIERARKRAEGAG